MKISSCFKQQKNVLLILIKGMPANLVVLFASIISYSMSGVSYC